MPHCYSSLHAIARGQAAPKMIEICVLLSGPRIGEWSSRLEVHTARLDLLQLKGDDAVDHTRIPAPRLEMNMRR